MNPEKTSPVFVIILSLVALCLLAGWSFISYRSAIIKTDIDTAISETRSQSTENIYLGSVRNALRDAKDDLLLVEDRFVDKDNVPEFISILEGIASRTDVRADLGSINIEQANKGEHGTLRIRMTGAGTWENAISFVATLDSIPFASKIETLNFSKPFDTEGRASTSTWNFNLELVQYLKEEK
jgi:hypothetical protein